MSDYTGWYVGMKVVCVDASPMVGFAGLEVELTMGRIYTIREIGPDFWLNDDRQRVDGVGIWLTEIIRKPCPYYGTKGIWSRALPPRNLPPHRHLNLHRHAEP